jgi:hypothetical protein
MNRSSLHLSKQEIGYATLSFKQFSRMETWPIHNQKSVADSIRGNLYCLAREPGHRASFSGDAVECFSWSRKLSCNERGQYLDGWPLHVINGGSGGILVFGGKPSSGWVLYGGGIVRRRQWKSSEKKKGIVFRRVSSSSNRYVVVYDGNRCIAKHPESTHVKLRDEASLRRGKV